MRTRTRRAAWASVRAMAVVMPLTGLVACTSMHAAPAPEVAGLFDVQGYRTGRYRAPVDRAPAPARRIALGDAARLVPGPDALFVDVLPVFAGWRDPDTGRWHLSEVHETIAGALWHPDAGRAPVEGAVWQALLASVDTARAQRPALPVVLFCRTDCWMGWNAARRLARERGGSVYWLSEGIEGWHAQGLRLAPATPVPVIIPQSN